MEHSWDLSANFLQDENGKSALRGPRWQEKDPREICRMNSLKMPGKRSVGWAAHCSGWGSITSPGIGGAWVVDRDLLEKQPQ